MFGRFWSGPCPLPRLILSLVGASLFCSLRSPIRRIPQPCSAAMIAGRHLILRFTAPCVSFFVVVVVVDLYTVASQCLSSHATQPHSHHNTA